MATGSLEIPFYQLDAFAARPFEGNPAAVCPLMDWLPDETLQAIAAENNLAETAFYVRDDTGWHIRWFTPIREVELCGHATLAAAAVVFLREPEGGDRIAFQSRSGPLHVSRDGEVLELDFPADPGRVGAVPDALVRGLGCAPVECQQAADYLAVYASEAEVRALRPDFARLRELDLRGVIATAPGDSVDFVSRFFAPNYGIDEDPVTGSAHCTLAPYWRDRLGKAELHARQISPRGGEIRCRLAGDRVLIAGRAVFVIEGILRLPSRV